MLHHLDQHHRQRTLEPTRRRVCPRCSVVQAAACADLLLQLLRACDAFEEFGLGDQDGVELQPCLLLLAPAAFPLYSTLSQELKHKELAVLGGCEEMALVVGDTQPRDGRAIHLGKAAHEGPSDRPSHG